jgi:hypothetical protein
MRLANPIGVLTAGAFHVRSPVRASRPVSVIRNLATLIRWVLGELEPQCPNLLWGTVLIPNLLS